MMLNHKFLLTWGFSDPFRCRTIRQRKRSIIDTIFRRHEVPSPNPSAPWVVQPLHRSGKTVAPIVRPGCYLPSDGCPNEYSVQNQNIVVPTLGKQ